MTGFIVLPVPHVVFVASSLCCLWLEVCKWDVTPQLSALFTSPKVTWVPKLCRQSVWCSELTHVSLCQCDIMHLPGSQEPPAMEPLLVSQLCQWLSLTLINCEVCSNSKGLLMKKVHKCLIRGCRGGKKLLQINNVKLCSCWNPNDPPKRMWLSRLVDSVKDVVFIETIDACKFPLCCQDHRLKGCL